MKVILLCHFSNEFVRSKLPLRYDNCIIRVIKKLFKKPIVSYIDSAMWITNSIVEFEKQTDIELHIVGPHGGLKKRTVEFSANGIHYHFFRINMPFPLSIFYNLYNRKYRVNRKIVRSIIHKIKPDIVNLVGAENPYYSICALDIDDIPVYLTCQTVYSNPTRYTMQSDPVSKERWNIEQQIFRKVKYFGCTGEMYYDLIKSANPNAIAFPASFPTVMLHQDTSIDKVFDFVWFAAHVSKKKGIDDALEALALVKKVYKDVTLLVVGKRDFEIDVYLNNTIARLGLGGNVIFHEPFQKHEDLMEYVQKAKFALLPIKMDVIPATVIESLKLGLPVVTSTTSGTPRLNEENETVLLSPIGDYEKLSSNMIALMGSPDLQIKLIQNGYDWVKRNASNEAIITRTICQYNLIFNHYYNHIQIPSEFEFDGDKQ